MKEYNVSPALFSAILELFHCYNVDFEERFAIVQSMFTQDEIDLAKKAVNAYLARKRRLNKRVSRMFGLYENIYFITLTLNDNYINDDYDLLVSRAKRAISCFPAWVLNGDTGEKFGRLHFHALCAGADPCDMLWKYGYCDARRCDTNVYDIIRLRSYMYKFSNHALKDTSLPRIWYSRLSSTPKVEETIDDGAIVT